MKEQAHKYLIDKGCLSMGQTYTAFQVEKMLIEFSQEQVKLQVFNKPNMTPKEKAVDIISMYLPFVDCGDNIYTTTIQIDNAKKCALIAVSEIQKAIDWHDFEAPNKEFDYWDNVVTEIKKWKNRTE